MKLFKRAALAAIGLATLAAPAAAFAEPSRYDYQQSYHDRDYRDGYRRDGRDWRAARRLEERREERRRWEWRREHQRHYGDYDNRRYDYNYRRY